MNNAHFADRQDISHIASEARIKMEIIEETLTNDSEERQEEEDTEVGAEEDTEEDSLFELENGVHTTSTETKSTKNEENTKTIWGV